MKPVIIIAIAVVLLIPLGVSNLIQQSYASFVIDGIELELIGFQKIESDKSDLLVLTISSFNNGKSATDFFWNYIYLIDSQERTFETEYYSNLQEKGFPITELDCPSKLYTTINAGLSAEEILCYEVPKGIGSSISLDLYNTDIELCDSPLTRDCQMKSFPVTLPQLSEPNNSFSKIPDWVKNIFVWYGQDLVSEGELLNAIKYLITEGILVIPSSEVETTETKVLTPPPKQTTLDDTTQSCSGSARCISGTVTRIVDGDTIHVDGQSIRFALASTPELNEYGGKEARDHIVQICPVGSKVLVDEDDGQTEGSYGRIVAMIYCNGLNLNDQVIENGYGYLSSGFCYKSEFSTHAWAKKHGC